MSLFLQYIRNIQRNCSMKTRIKQIFITKKNGNLVGFPFLGFMKHLF